MSNSFSQSEIAKASNNLKIDLHMLGASKKTSSPLIYRMHAISAMAMRIHHYLRAKKFNPNKDNFDSMLFKYSTKVKMTFKNIPADYGIEEKIGLTLQSMKNFTLEKISRKIL